MQSSDTLIRFVYLISNKATGVSGCSDFLMSYRSVIIQLRFTILFFCDFGNVFFFLFSFLFDRTFIGDPQPFLSVNCILKLYYH